MPRTFSEKRWLKEFDDPTFKTRVFTVSERIWEKRAIMPYPDVIRAKVMILALNPVGGTVGRTKDFVKQVGVSYGNLWNYFTRNVRGWVERMEERLAVKLGGARITPGRRLLSHDDLVWIGEFLEPYRNESWTKQLKLVRGKALHDDTFKHLCRLPRSTLWNHRNDLGRLADLAKAARDKCKPKRLRSSAAKERDSMVVLPEFLKPEAAVIPLTFAHPKEVDQWTGNPF